jgi:uridylate kinase
VLDENLQVMDSTAVALCMENRLPIIVFKITERDNLRRVVTGKARYTYVFDESTNVKSVDPAGG